MLSDREKKEMLADGLSGKRRQEFLIAEKKKSKPSRTLNDYIAFLTEAQRFKSFEHKRVITPTEKNIL